MKKIKIDYNKKIEFFKQAPMSVDKISEVMHDWFFDKVFYTYAESFFYFYKMNFDPETKIKIENGELEKTIQQWEYEHILDLYNKLNDLPIKELLDKKIDIENYTLREFITNKPRDFVNVIVKSKDKKLLVRNTDKKVSFNDFLIKFFLTPNLNKETNQFDFFNNSNIVCLDKFYESYRLYQNDFLLKIINKKNWDVIDFTLQVNIAYKNTLKFKSPTSLLLFNCFLFSKEDNFIIHVLYHRPSDNEILFKNFYIKADADYYKNDDYILVSSKRHKKDFEMDFTPIKFAESFYVDNQITGISNYDIDNVFKKVLKYFANKYDKNIILIDTEFGVNRFIEKSKKNKEDVNLEISNNDENSNTEINVKDSPTENLNEEIKLKTENTIKKDAHEIFEHILKYPVAYRDFYIEFEQTKSMDSLKNLVNRFIQTKYVPTDNIRKEWTYNDDYSKKLLSEIFELFNNNFKHQNDKTIIKDKKDSPTENSNTEIEIMEHETSTSYTGNPYKLLSRLQQDCENFLNGNRNEKRLFYENAKVHIQSMKKIWNELTEKPQWLSMKDIEDYERRMLNEDSSTENEISELKQENKMNDKIKKLDVQNKGLTNLDLSNYPDLISLDCSNNHLLELDLSNNPNLEFLDCQLNYLKKLDITNNPKLEELHCGSNGDLKIIITHEQSQKIETNQLMINRNANSEIIVIEKIGKKEGYTNNKKEVNTDEISDDIEKALIVFNKTKITDTKTFELTYCNFFNNLDAVIKSFNYLNSINFSNEDETQKEEIERNLEIVNLLPIADLLTKEIGFGKYKSNVAKDLIDDKPYLNWILSLFKDNDCSEIMKGIFNSSNLINNKFELLDSIDTINANTFGNAINLFNPKTFNSLIGRKEKNLFQQIKNLASQFDVAKTQNDIRQSYDKISFPFTDANKTLSKILIVYSKGFDVLTIDFELKTIKKDYTKYKTISDFIQLYDVAPFVYGEFEYTLKNVVQEICDYLNYQMLVSPSIYKSEEAIFFPDYQNTDDDFEKEQQGNENAKLDNYIENEIIENEVEQIKIKPVEQPKNQLSIKKLIVPNQRPRLKTLDLSIYPDLIILNCEDNLLTELDCSKNVYLKKIECGTNRLSKLNIGNNPNLEQLSCMKNQLTKLDLSNTPNLKWLFAPSNKLVELDCSNNPKIKTIDIDGNLESLNLKNTIELEELRFSSLQLKELDVSDSPKLQEISCSGLFSELDFTNNPLLKDLYVYSHEESLKKIKFNNNDTLEILQIANVELPEFDISIYPNLVNFDSVFSSKIEKIFISKEQQKYIDNKDFKISSKTKIVVKDTDTKGKDIETKEKATDTSIPKATDTSIPKATPTKEGKIKLLQDKIITLNKLLTIQQAKKETEKTLENINLLQEKLETLNKLLVIQKNKK